MSDGAWPRVPAANASEVALKAGLGEEALALLDEGQPPRSYLAALLAAALHLDAVRFMAYALPKREAVWWACRCARAIEGPEPEKAVDSALAAAEAWAADPSEPNRRAAMAAAEAVGFGSPAGCAAVAAFYSGGSLAPADLPEVPPGEHLTPRAVAGAVQMAAVRDHPEQAPATFREFLAIAEAIARGGDRYPDAPRVATPPPRPAAAASATPYKPPPTVGPVPKPAMPTPTPTIPSSTTPIPRRPAPPGGFFKEK